MPPKFKKKFSEFLAIQNLVLFYQNGKPLVMRISQILNKIKERMEFDKFQKYPSQINS